MARERKVITRRAVRLLLVQLPGELQSTHFDLKSLQMRDLLEIIVEVYSTILIVP